MLKNTSTSILFQIFSILVTCHYCHCIHKLLLNPYQQLVFDDGSSSVPSTALPNNKVWLFAVDGRRTPYNFLDENGKLVGFDVDLVSKVCQTAQRKCKVVLAEFTECTMTVTGGSYPDINYPGRGLMAGWFDACPGYVISVERLGAFDFTKPYLETDASFTVAPGNPRDFDPDSDDYSKFTLAHLTGAVTNGQCLTRLKKKFGNILIAENLPDAKSLLLNGQADVLFSPRQAIPDLEVLPQRVRCDLGGTAVISKKGSHLSRWWDRAFKKLVRSGEFDKLCSDSQLKYNATIRCLSDNQVHQPLASSEINDVSATTVNMAQDMGTEKVWLFTSSGHRKPFSYVDEEGRLRGWNLDLVAGVCAEAGQQCDFVLSPFTECSFTQRNINYAGRGLMEGWFDACVGYANSLDRENAVDFTDAFLPSSAYFTVLPGNPSGFNPKMDDFSKFTISHLTGAYTNAECLNRLKKKFGKIIIAANLPEAKQLLFDKKIDVIFAPRSSIPDLETLPEAVHCEETGSSIMVKKGSDLPEWWNPAFKKFVKRGLYQKLCKEGGVKYNRTINCLPEDRVLFPKTPFVDLFV